MLCIMLALLLLFVDCSSSLIASEHPPQPDTLVITKEMLAKGVSLDSLRVRFHAGDDMRWKERDFDDSRWKILKANSLYTDNSLGVSWIRFHLNLDKEVSTTIAYISSWQWFSAVEIYLDGKLILSNGVPAAKPDDEIIGRF